MKRTFKHILMILILATGLAALSGCRSLREENPDEHQLPWATPANWEGTIPGMPTKG